jgi:hypothetical protein
MKFSVFRCNVDRTQLSSVYPLICKSWHHTNYLCGIWAESHNCKHMPKPHPRWILYNETLEVRGIQYVILYIVGINNSRIYFKLSTAQPNKVINSKYINVCHIYPRETVLELNALRNTEHTQITSICIYVITVE